MKRPTENNSLKNFIHVERKIIPKDTCKFVIDTIENCSWTKHTWSINEKKESFSYPAKELDVLHIPENLENVLNIFVSKSIKSYNNYIGEEKISQVTRFSPIRFNRYQKGQIMRKHCDHIRSIFDGEVRGIPTLSIIINLNDNYKGGDLIFWEDYKVNLYEGDIVIFPSLFLFPHRVEEVTENIRYSGVTWGI